MFCDLGLSCLFGTLTVCANAQGNFGNYYAYKELSNRTSEKQSASQKNMTNDKQGPVFQNYYNKVVS